MKSKCRFCGDVTNLANATGPRQKLGVCPPCFKAYRPPTDAQIHRVEAVVRHELGKALGVNAEVCGPTAVAISKEMVENGDATMSDEMLHKYAKRAVDALTSRPGASRE